MPTQNWFKSMKILISALVSLMILFAAFGAFFSVNPHEMGGNMPGCPFAEFGASFCPLNLSDYLTHWRATWADTSSVDNVMAIVLALVVLLATSAVFTKLLTLQPNVHHPPGRKKVLSIYGLGYLREVFSSGILHPKLYA